MLLWLWHGTVQAKRQQAGAQLVDVKVEAINQRQEKSAFGTAVVALPSREFGPVSLPLAQPE